MLRRAGLMLALAAAMWTAAAPPAGAHAVLESTTPALGAALATAPAAVELRFTEPVEIGLGSVRVHASGGEEVQRGDAFHPRGDERVVAVRLRDGLRDGAYTATYRVVSRDSHPLAGGFVFGVGAAGSAAAISPDELLGDGGGPVTSAAFAAVRALQFAAIALAVGGFAVLVLVWLPALAGLARPEPAWPAAAAAFAARWRRLLSSAAVAGLTSAVLALPLQAATGEGSSFWSGLGATGDVLGTRFGTVYALGALAWLAVLVLTAPPARRVPALRAASVGATGVAVPRAGAWGRALALPLALLVLLPALAGHAGVEEPVAVMLPANVLHVLAASAWIGGIATLLLALRAATRRLDPADRTHALVAVLGRFSTLALASVAMLLLGGVLQAALQLEAVSDLVDSAYGRAILVKSGLVVLLLALGGLNRWLPSDRAGLDHLPLDDARRRRRFPVPARRAGRRHALDHARRACHRGRHRTAAAAHRARRGGAAAAGDGPAGAARRRPRRHRRGRRRDGVQRGRRPVHLLPLLR